VTMFFIRAHDGQTHLGEVNSDHQYRPVCGAVLATSYELGKTLSPGATLCIACRAAKSATGQLKTRTPSKQSPCYCSTPVRQVISDINAVAVPAGALVELHCWSQICKVRGLNFRRIDAASWSELCTERGYLLRRHNRY